MVDWTRTSKRKADHATLARPATRHLYSPTLYVLEIAHNSLLAQSPEGALIKVDPDGSRSIVLDGLFFPGGVALDDDGDLYVTYCGICATDGEVLRVTP